MANHEKQKQQVDIKLKYTEASFDKLEYQPCDQDGPMKDRDRKWMQGVDGAHYKEDPEEFNWLDESVTTDQIPDHGKLIEDKVEIYVSENGHGQTAKIVDRMTQYLDHEIRLIE